MMKFTAQVLAMSVLLAASAAQAAGPIHSRPQNQQARIARGAADGSLTRGEVRLLRGEQQAIRDQRRGALADDGRVGPVEARRLDRARDRASRDIYRLRHNERQR
jgi:hypothetical protein